MAIFPLEFLPTCPIAHSRVLEAGHFWGNFISLQISYKDPSSKQIGQFVELYSLRLMQTTCSARHRWKC